MLTGELCLVLRELMLHVEVDFKPDYALYL